MDRKQRLLEEYFNEKAVVVDVDVPEYRIAGAVYQVVPSYVINNEYDLAWIASFSDTIKYKGYFLIKQ